MNRGGRWAARCGGATDPLAPYLAEALAWYDGTRNGDLTLDTDEGPLFGLAGSVQTLANRATGPGAWGDAEPVDTYPGPGAGLSSGLVVNSDGQHLVVPGASLNGLSHVTLFGWVGLRGDLATYDTFSPLIAQGNQVQAGSSAIHFGGFKGDGGARGILSWQGTLDSWSIAQDMGAALKEPAFLAATFAAGTVAHWKGHAGITVSSAGEQHNATPPAALTASGAVRLLWVDNAGTHSGEYSLRGSAGVLGVIPRALLGSELEVIRRGTNPLRVCVCVGNSLVQGYCDGATLAHPWPARVQVRRGWLSTVANLGGGGGTTQNMIDAYPSAVRPLLRHEARENVLFVWEGSNALWVNGNDPVITLAQLVSYCETAAADGWRIVVGTVIPRDYGSAAWEAGRLAVNAGLRAIAAERGWRLCDLAARSEFSDFSNLTYFGADKTHLNQTGADLAAQLWEAAAWAP